MEIPLRADLSVCPSMKEMGRRIRRFFMENLIKFFVIAGFAAAIGAVMVTVPEFMT